ncbi:MAG TPA: LON peptidase substrate-binding domain-containing protein [Candidatus Sulfotelmatobacter sp.]|nr:LON peptidase substrate-binding domain-containing protein [Candidatus Sulfotelmatobacter sp.]
MSGQPEQGFPLFPLNIVALPTETVPLHIFEERYKRMIEDCLEQECELGIVWLAEEELKEVGCACEIDRVLSREEDGSMDIVVRGTRPFQLISREHDLPYPAGVIEQLEDDAEEDDAEVAREARELYRELVEQATERELSDEELAELDAYEMAGTVEFGTDAKQELLELRSENARMRLLALLFRAAIERLALIDRAQARALSNGKVRFG